MQWLERKRPIIVNRNNDLIELDATTQGLFEGAQTSRLGMTSVVRGQTLKLVVQDNFV